MRKRHFIKSISMILTLAMLLGVMIVLPVTAGEAVEAWGDADGDGVYYISTADELKAFASEVNDNDTYFSGKTIKLAADIDLNEGWDASTKTAAPYAWTSIYQFEGTFDGQGHTISGLYINGTANATKRGDADENSAFIFRLHGGKVQNVAFKNIYITGDAYRMATVAAYISLGNGELTNIYSDAIICYSGSDAGICAGGMVGEQNGSDTIYNNCVFAGSISGFSAAVGGILGVNDKVNVKMTDCVNLGNIIIDNSKNKLENETAGKAHTTVHGAGLIGESGWHVEMTNCVNIGEISVSDESDEAYNERVGTMIMFQRYMYHHYIRNSASTGFKSASSEFTITDSYYLASSAKVTGGTGIATLENKDTPHSTEGKNKVTVCYDGFGDDVRDIDSTTKRNTYAAVKDCIKSVSSIDELLTKNGYDDWVIYGDEVMPESVAKMVYGVGIVGYQATDVDTTDGTFDIRFIAGIDKLDYDAVGFDITLECNGETYTLPETQSETDTVYTSVMEDGTPKSAEALGTKFLYMAVVDNVATEDSAGEAVSAKITVRAYAEKDGARIYTGATYVLTSDGSTIAWNK